ncbi:transmembrane protein [Anaeramoeba flamelloides]|uniref:Transmembrane protein n=1 Tax=Anaeramoeba flamelloides TaxID=1746091 RepID=A0AAV7YNY6_9EUKA|nr:transmembrane protein [Anaeramoeba flamelloides]
MDFGEIRMKIDSWDKKKFGFFYLVFFVILTLCLIIGGLGPDRYKQQVFGYTLKSNQTRFVVEVVDLNRLNQFLFVDSHFSNDNKMGFTQNVEFKAWLWGTNDLKNATYSPNFEEDTTVGISSQNGDGDDDGGTTDGWDLLEYSKHKREVKCEASENCTAHTMLFVPYIHHKNYVLGFEFNNTSESKYSKIYIDIYFVNKSMTYFELIFRYFFVILSIGWICYITNKTHGISFRTFSLEQKWSYILLYFLLLFNNPIWPTILISDHSIVQVFDGIFVVTFIIALFAFWISIIDGLRFERSERKIFKFYLPKLIPLLVLWITFFVIFIYSRIHEYDDPQFETINDIPGFLASKILFWIFIVFYVLYLLYSIIRAFIEVKEKPKFKKRFYFFFSLFFISFVMLLVVFIGNFIPNLSNTSMEFLSYFTIFNIYLILLSYAYLPSSKTIDELQNPHEKLGDEEEDISNDSSNVEMSEKKFSDSENSQSHSQSKSQSQSRSRSQSEIENISNSD